MQKKKLILLILVLPIIGILLLFIFKSNDKVRIEGRYILSDNGTHLIVSDYCYGHDVPFQMSSKNDPMFNNLTSGDKIRITTGGYIQECYPPIIGAFSCKKIADGELGDISDTVLRELTFLGFIKSNVVNTAKFKTDDYTLSIDLQERWNYKLLPDNQGIRIWPQYVQGGSVDIIYYPEGVPIEMFSNYHAQEGRLNYDGYTITGYLSSSPYDNTAYDWFDLRSWEYIHFSEPYNKFVICNNGGETWNELLIATMQDIIKTIKFE